MRKSFVFFMLVLFVVSHLTIVWVFKDPQRREWVRTKVSKVIQWD